MNDYSTTHALSLLEFHQRYHNSFQYDLEVARMLSQESFFSGAKDFFVKSTALVAEGFMKVKGLLADSRSIFSSTNNFYLKDLKKREATMRTLINSSTYDDFTKLEIMYHVGLNKNMPEAASLIQRALRDVDENLLGCLNYLDALITHVYADKDFRESTSYNKSLIVNYALPKKDEVTDTVSQLISPNQRRDIWKFTEAYPNLSSMVSTYDSLFDIPSIIDLKMLQTISKRIESTMKKLDVLYNEAKYGKLVFSKPVLLGMSEDIKFVATYITSAVSIVHLHHRVTETLTMTIDRMQTLKQR